jgi:hypothetical protein
MYAGCPLVWVLKLQTEVALSTMEAEYIALSQAMRDLIPLLGILEELTPVLKLNKDQPHVFWKSCGFDEDSNNLIANLYEDNQNEAQNQTHCIKIPSLQRARLQRYNKNQFDWYKRSTCRYFHKSIR